MKQINFILQGKGGVGKSYISSLLAQFYMDQKRTPICIDTDPVNATFAGYKAFDATELKLGEKSDEINPRSFDQLIEQISESEDESTFVIDNGAATFLPLVSYISENKILDMLADMNCEVKIHSILTGGQALNDTMVGMDELFKTFPDISVVVWLNEYFGLVEKDGKGFQQSKLYDKNKNRISAIITLPEVTKETFGIDIEMMLKARQTYAEAMEDSSYTVMHRHRLRSTWYKINSTLQEAQL